MPNGTFVFFHVSPSLSLSMSTAFRSLLYTCLQTAFSDFNPSGIPSGLYVWTSAGYRRFGEVRIEVSGEIVGLEMGPEAFRHDPCSWSE